MPDDPGISTIFRPASEAADEAEQRRGLRRHRMRATSLLLVAAAAFLTCSLVPEPGFWVLLARAGAEAAMVGGLADWFAVTALFRHPLGIPIPHTALIPRQKDRLAAGLASFMERNFLSPDVVVAKLRRMNVAGMLAGWAVRRENADAVAGRLVAAIPVLINSIQDREIRRLVRTALNAQLGSADLGVWVARLVRLLTEGGHHQLLFDQALSVARRLLADHQEQIYAMVEDRSRWWIPRSIDRRVAQALIEGVLELLGELAAPDHPARHRFDAAVRELADRFEQSPELRARVEAFKRDLIENPALQDYIGSVWDELRHMLVRDATAPASRLKRALARGIVAFAADVTRDAATQERLNVRLESMVTRVVLPWRREIGQLIVDVVKGWDPETVAARIELEVGRDLQYIRINGTVVGALVGCALFVFSWFVLG